MWLASILQIALDNVSVNVHKYIATPRFMGENDLGLGTRYFQQQ